MVFYRLTLKYTSWCRVEVRFEFFSSSRGQIVKIGEVARQVGLTVETVRYYEKQGLIAEPGRNTSGYRQYSTDIVEHLYFIKRAKKLGFSLKEIKELVALRDIPGVSCKEVREQAREKIAGIRQKIAELQKIENDLMALISRCPGQGPLKKCPIIGPMGIPVPGEEK